MPTQNNGNLIDEAGVIQAMRQQAETQNRITLSLSKVMYGFVDEYGGEERFGHELAKLSKSEEVNIASRVSLMNNFTRLLAATAQPDEDNDELFSEEQIRAQIRQLEKEQ